MEPFVFNKQIDHRILYELYENDYTYIEKIFTMFLGNDFDEDLGMIRFCHASGDLDGLRKIIHKIKPGFGFMGMPGIEQKCESFEKICDGSLTTGELTDKLNELLEVINEGKTIIETDLQKLIIFNKNDS